jgi:histidine triad (HIT) family protein
MSDCLFCKIARGDIPCRKVYEDEEVIAFHDINPAAAVHFLIVPKRHVDSLAHCDASHGALLNKMLFLAPKLAEEQGLKEGFKTVINTGKGGGQVVFHLHVHILGGGKLQHV